MGAAQPRHFAGIVGGHVLALSWVSLDVVQFFAAYQPPAACHHGIGPFLRRHGVLPVLKEVDPVAGKAGQAAMQQRCYVPAVEVHVRRVEATKVDEGRQHVDMKTHFVDVPSALETAAGPPEEEGHAMTTVVVGALLAPHPRVVSPHRVLVLVEFAAPGTPVVGHEDQDGVFLQAPFGKRSSQAAEVLVDVRDHAAEFRLRHVRVAAVGLGVFLGHEIRGVRGVGGEIDEERRVRCGRVRRWRVNFGRVFRRCVVIL